MEIRRVLTAMLVAALLALPAAAQSGGTAASGSSDQAGQSQTSPDQTKSGAQTSSDKSAMPQSDQQSDQSAGAAKGKSKGKKTSSEREGASGTNPDTQNTAAGNTAGANMKTVSRKDRLFMEKAAAGGLMEVDLGNTAQEKAQSEDVKSFGKRMTDDHSKANKELQSLMSEKGLSAPTDLPAKDKASGDKLKAMSGADFDKSYMSHMVKDHQKDVNEFQRAAKTAADPDVKAFAAKTLPTLQDHLKQAKEVAGKVGASTAGGKHHKERAAKAEKTGSYR